MIRWFRSWLAWRRTMRLPVLDRRRGSGFWRCLAVHFHRAQSPGALEE